MEPVKLFTNTNEETGMESYVVQGKTGFHVCTKDLDNGNVLPYVTIHPNLDLATSQAKKNI